MSRALSRHAIVLRDMNVSVSLTDGRRIEVLANGLPPWQGAQAAVDTNTGVPSHAGRRRATKCRSNRRHGACAVGISRRKANAFVPTRSLRSFAVAKLLCLAWRLVADSATRPSPSDGSWPRACWLWRRSARWLLRFLSCRWWESRRVRRHGTPLGDLLADARDAEAVPVSEPSPRSVKVALLCTPASLFCCSAIVNAACVIRRAKGPRKKIDTRRIPLAVAPGL